MAQDNAPGPGTPPAEGLRQRWADVPERVRRAVERGLRSRVVSIREHPTGFSPGFAGTLSTADGQSVFAKAGWFDLVCFAPSVTMQGGPPPEVLITQYPGCRGVDEDAMTAAIAAIAGYFTHRSLQPPPPGLPTVRGFQAAQALVARQWLAERLKWM